jgi:hypothetical protein
VSSQNALLRKFFSPLLPTLPQFKQTFFILGTSAAIPAAFAAFFPFPPILSPSNNAECFPALLSLQSHRESSAKADHFLSKFDTL